MSSFSFPPQQSHKTTYMGEQAESPLNSLRAKKPENHQNWRKNSALRGLRKMLSGESFSKFQSGANKGVWHLKRFLFPSPCAFLPPLFRTGARGPPATSLSQVFKELGLRIWGRRRKLLSKAAFFRGLITADSSRSCPL